MIIEYLNMLTAIISILAAGYILARIHLRMRVLTAGTLLAFGILQLRGAGEATQIIHLVTHMSVVGCLVYFATVANSFVTTSTKIAISTDRHKRCKDEESNRKPLKEITDFPPSTEIATRIMTDGR